MADGQTLPAEVLPSNAPAVIEQYGARTRLTVSDVTAHVDLIAAVANKVMKPDVHYGKIPNAGDKPTLLKAGAELLCVTFMLSPVYVERRVTERDDFIAYVIECQLTTSDGKIVATGIGACNSREKKYRYRSSNTGKLVPQEYWKNRDKELLGGPQFEARKITNPKTKKTTWYIFEQMENTEIWDLQNTLNKMAQKRSLIAATLNATATSSYFTQDLEDMATDHITPASPADDDSAAGSGYDSESPPAEAGNGQAKAEVPQSDLYVDLLTKLSEAKTLTELDEVAFGIRNKKEGLTAEEVEGLGNVYLERKKSLQPKGAPAAKKGATK